MSSDPPPLNPTPAPQKHRPAMAPLGANLSSSSHAPSGSDKIIVYRHSNLFYWWPIWAFGFLFALITWFDSQTLAVVPRNTVAAEQRKVDIDGKGTMEERDVLILEKSKHLVKRMNEGGVAELVQPTVQITRYRSLGILYVVLLLLVIAITSVSMRGLWTVLFLVTIIMLTILFSVLGWWEIIFHKISQGRGIYLNLGGYILISLPLFILWLVNFLFLDRQTYLIFTPGQIRVRLEIGGAENVYDAMGMVIQRERGDLFRHWVLGFGSGDLIIKPVGVTHPLLFPNVLRVGKITEGIERMMKEKVIVKFADEGPPSA